MKKNRLFRVSVLILAIIMVMGFLFSALVSSSYAARVKRSYTSKGYAASTSARAMATLEMSTGRMLYSKNAEAKLPMASTTKIVTAITVIENCPDIDAKIKVNPKAIGVEGTSIYLQRGEELSVRELLLGLMLRSGNDAATALALHVSPTVDDFCKKMQETAVKCGATDSNFKNAHGLDEEGHYTTAKDLGLITCYALKNPIFAEIVKTKSAKISGIDYPRLLRNKNRLLSSLDGCIGVKTGFTKKAGRCYVGARENNGMTTVCVILNCGPMFEECEALLKQAAQEYSLHKILTKDDFIKVTSGDKVGLSFCDFRYPLTEQEVKELEVTLNDGKVQVTLNKKLISEEDYVMLNL